MSDTKADLTKKPKLQAAWNFASCMLAHPTQEYKYTPRELPGSFRDAAGQCYYREVYSIPSGKSASLRDVLSKGGEVKVEMQRANIVFNLELVYVSDDQPIEIAIRCSHSTASYPYIYLQCRFDPQTHREAVRLLDFQVPPTGLRKEVYVAFAIALQRWFDGSIELDIGDRWAATFDQLSRLADKKESKSLVSA